MHQLAHLLATLPLPEPDRADDAPKPPGDLLAGCSPCDGEVIQELGAGLPAGHLHVWGGPCGAGKTAFLLCLMQAAAVQGRRVVYATYDLPPETLAMRLLATTAGVPWRQLPDPGGSSSTCKLNPDELERALAARELLSRLPFDVLPARGFSARSLRDRVTRMPFRAEILAVDYLQGVIRRPGSEMGVALRELSDLAAQLHLAVVCAVRSGDEAAEELDELRQAGAGLPDRVGWLAPPAGVGLETSGVRQAEVVHNRYGQTPAIPLHLDEPTGTLGRIDVIPAELDPAEVHPAELDPADVGRADATA